MNVTLTQRLLPCAVLLFSLLAGTACSSNQPVGEQLDDALITGKVKAKLTADSDVNPFNVDVDTNQGVVRLSGVVEDRRTRREAVKLARGTKGVMRVINEIEIGKQTVGDRIDDAAIVAAIKTKLTSDPEVSPNNVDVDCVQGVVTLSGRVETQRAKEAAGDVARATDDVREVRNRLEVEDNN